MRDNEVEDKEERKNEKEYLIPHSL